MLSHGLPHLPSHEDNHLLPYKDHPEYSHPQHIKPASITTEYADMYDDEINVSWEEYSRICHKSLLEMIQKYVHTMNLCLLRSQSRMTSTTQSTTFTLVTTSLIGKGRQTPSLRENTKCYCLMEECRLGGVHHHKYSSRIPTLPNQTVPDCNLHS